MATTPWRGCVAADRNGFLNIKVKVEGRWRYRSTGLKDTPENRREAEQALANIREDLQAQDAAMRGAPGPVTVRAWSRKWMETRREQVADAPNDQSRLDLHVLPVIGDFMMKEVRPRHVLDVVNRARATLAPRTIRNIYSVMQALFREATIADLIESSPCLLTSRHLGKIRDKRPGWRDTAVYTRAELASLLWDPRIPLGRRVLWGLLGVACLRVGEAAGLRWGRLDLAYEPLGRLSVVTSYDHDKTKTETERWMPVHAALAGLLAEWRLSGWQAAFGRQPEPGDLVVPVLPEPRRKGRVRWPGSMLDKNWVLKRLRGDVGRLLAARQRRVHDLRRTGITLAIEDGAEEVILKRGTHAPPRHVMALYTSVQWKTLCREVAKLQLERPEVGAVVALR